MKFRPHGFFPCILAIVLTIVASTTAAYADFTIELSTNDSTTQNAPSGEIEFNATASGGSITKIVFYRNDVPYKTFIGSDSTRLLSEEFLGVDTYKYRARAYDATKFVDSNEIVVTINTPFVFKMGQVVPAFGPHPSPLPTDGPGRGFDHASQIQRAVDYLAWRNDGEGGTLYFPCTPNFYPAPNGSLPDPQSIYNIDTPINIPSNVSLVGESSEEYGRCRIYWRDPSWDPPPSPAPTPTPSPTPTPDPNATPTPNPNCHDNPGTLTNKAMFQVRGGSSRVRIKDLWLYSRSSGPECYVRRDYDRIAVENTVAIGLYGDTGHVRDVIIENVSITDFTFGIRATSCTNHEDFVGCTQTNNEITGVRMRGIKPATNHRQLFINSRYAYDWDVQNFNITSMAANQGAVEIVESGKPGSPVSENTQLKFLQLNCNAASPETFCVRIKKHGGLYFKLLHAEGPRTAFEVADMGFVQNTDPIILEASGATGVFEDANMDLYMISNFAGAAPGPDETRWGGRMEFKGAGVEANVYDCGDIWGDRTDVVPSTPPAWEDWQMVLTHTERNRVTLFATNSADESVSETHTPCPANISEFGGDFFDTGVMPTQLLYDDNGPNTQGGSMVPAYTHRIEYACGILPPVDITAELYDALYETITGVGTFPRRGAVYIDGCVEITDNIVIPSGKQIIGGPSLDIFYSGSDASLFTINAPLANRTTSVILRNLKMTGSGSKAAISILGAEPIAPTDAGLLSDVHFSGLTIDNFGTGLSIDPDDNNPMLDGVSVKNSTFTSNVSSVTDLSDNTSNWNVQNLTMESEDSDAVGLRAILTGLSLQGVSCRGVETTPMVSCIDMKSGTMIINGFQAPEHVTNSITVQEGYVLFDQSVYEGRMPSTLLIRNSDFRSSDEVAGAGKINLLGKAFITSMNNKYENFYIANPNPSGGEGPQSEFSRVTICDDAYETAGNVPYPGIDENFPNIWVGVPTPTVVECSGDPYSYEDTFRHGGNYDNDPSPSVRNEDQPMVGNFYDEVQEDYVIYRPGQTTNAQSYFLIKQAGGDASTSVQWGLHGDLAMVGKIFANTDTAQLIIFRSGAWWVKDPKVTNPANSTYAVYSFGTTDDIPFVGNFIDEAGDFDELAVYRPSTDTFWIMDPRGVHSPISYNRGAEYGNNIVVADFLGEDYEQIAQYVNGTWNIFDPNGGPLYTPSLGDSNSVPVPGKYLPGDCAQLAVWDPDTQEFILRDMPMTGDTCGTRDNVRIFWGSNNDLVLPFNLPGGGTRSNACPTTYNNVTLKDDNCPGGDCANDIPLHINTDNDASDLRKPVAYRQSTGHYYCGVANGQWWIHDLIQ